MPEVRRQAHACRSVSRVSRLGDVVRAAGRDTASPVRVPFFGCSVAGCSCDACAAASAGGSAADSSRPPLLPHPVANKAMVRTPKICFHTSLLLLRTELWLVQQFWWSGEALDGGLERRVREPCRVQNEAITIATPSVPQCRGECTSGRRRSKLIASETA